METDPVKYIFMIRARKKYFITAERKRFDGKYIFAETM